MRKNTEATPLSANKRTVKCLMRVRISPFTMHSNKISHMIKAESICVSCHFDIHFLGHVMVCHAVIQRSYFWEAEAKRLRYRFETLTYPKLWQVILLVGFLFLSSGASWLFAVVSPWSSWGRSLLSSSAFFCSSLLFLNSNWNSDTSNLTERKQNGNLIKRFH